MEDPQINAYAPNLHNRRAQPRAPYPLLVPPRREPQLPESTPKPTNPAPAASIESDEGNKQKKKERAIEGAGSPGGGKKLTGGAARSPGCGCPGNMGGCCATCCMSSACCISCCCCCCCAAAAACFILCCCGCMPATIARPRLLGFGRGTSAPLTNEEERKKPKEKKRKKENEKKGAPRGRVEERRRKGCGDGRGEASRGRRIFSWARHVYGFPLTFIETRCRSYVSVELRRERPWMRL
jgi:hypothetical protein